MFLAFVVTTVLFIGALVSAFLFFRGPDIIRYIMCVILDHHEDRIMAVSYAKGWALIPMRRHVIRRRVMVCSRCFRESVVVDHASVAHDWQNPERLFR